MPAFAFRHRSSPQPWAIRVLTLYCCGRNSAALDLLAPAVQRFPQHIELQAQFVNTLLEARSQEHTLPALRQAVSRHGEHPRLLASVCTVKLLQRQPSLARRAAFIQRLWPNDAQKDKAACQMCSWLMSKRAMPIGWLIFHHPHFVMPVLNWRFKRTDAYNLPVCNLHWCPSNCKQLLPPIGKAIAPSWSSWVSLGQSSRSSSSCALVGSQLIFVTIQWPVL